MFRALPFNFAGAALLAGCVFISTENAQHSADLAAAAAASCPAAAGAAETARQAAADAEQAAQDFQTQQDQASALREDAERARAEADLYRRRSQDAANEQGRLNDLLGQTREDAALMAQSCRLDAAAYREDDSEWFSFTLMLDTETGLVGATDEGGYALPTCDCDSAASCDAAAEHFSDDAEFLATSDRLLEEAQAAIEENLAAAERADARAQELEDQAAEEAAAARFYERRIEAAEELAAEAAADAQEIAFEKCGSDGGATMAAPGPDGTYNQDIFGSQNRGMSLGACPVGSPTQTSCLVIQFQCNVSCVPGVSCSPGAPAGCLACYAAGCI